jgi:hypothetical protein
MHRPDVRILDPQALAAVLTAIERRLGGQLLAAKALGFSQGHFSRLRRGVCGARLRPAFFERIRRLAGGELHGLLERAVADRTGEALHREYVSWRAKTWRHLLEGHEAAQMELNARLRDYPAWRREMRRYRQKAGDHDERRVDLGLVRVQEPLWQAWTAHGVERTVDELAAAGDLGRYLRAAFDRELILLEREADWPRAQGIARRSAHAPR